MEKICITAAGIALVLASLFAPAAAEEGWVYYRIASNGWVVGRVPVSGPGDPEKGLCEQCMWAKGAFSVVQLRLAGTGVAIRRYQPDIREEGTFRDGRLWHGTRRSADGGEVRLSLNEAGLYDGVVSYRHGDGLGEDTLYTAGARAGRTVLLLEGGVRVECDLVDAQPKDKCLYIVKGNKPRQVAVVLPRIDRAAWRGVPGGYPPLSLRLHEQGRCILSMMVDETGAVTHAWVSESSGSPRLDDVTMLTGKQTRFLPATIDGVAVKAHYLMSLVWKIPEPTPPPPPGP